MDNLYGATIYLVRQTEVLPPKEVLPPSGVKTPSLICPTAEILATMISRQAVENSIPPAKRWELKTLKKRLSHMRSLLNVELVKCQAIDPIIWSAY